VNLNWNKDGNAGQQGFANATLNAARLLKQDGSVGSIGVGKRADLLLVEGNPAENISDIRRCRLVMKNGTLYDSAALYHAVGSAGAK
jgi:imidazolonepropionase-like amidohydrolase